jgi:hypothetical protein
MGQIDPEERESILEELEDLAALRGTFEERGFKGVMITCAECGEDHYYGWDMLQESLEYMLDTGEPRMHEPAFQPEPEDYIAWDYGRGYIDAIAENDAQQTKAPPAERGIPNWFGDRSRCGFCRARLPVRGMAEWTYCPHCAASLAPLRLVDALHARGWDDTEITGLMDECGFEAPLLVGEDPENPA